MLSVGDINICALVNISAVSVSQILNKITVTDNNLITKYETSS